MMVVSMVDSKVGMKVVSVVVLKVGLMAFVKVAM